MYQPLPDFSGEIWRGTQSSQETSICLVTVFGWELPPLWTGEQAIWGLDPPLKHLSPSPDQLSRECDSVNTLATPEGHRHSLSPSPGAGEGRGYKLCDGRACSEKQPYHLAVPVL